MKNIILSLLFFCLVYKLGYSQNYYPYNAVPFSKVKLNDNFWSEKLEINRTVTIPWSFYQCQTTGRIKNFENAAARNGKLCGVYVFDDSDVYKIIEGASYSLHVKYDKTLDQKLDSLIALIAKAQEPDGYLFTTRTMGDSHEWIGTERYEKEHELSHELYNVGHFYEAASAHFQATGKRSMLEIAIKNADHLLTVFGPGKKSVAPGHQVIEMGLVKLYLATGKKEYLQLSQFFIEARGKRIYEKTPGTPGATVWETGEYWQDHKPAIEQTEAIGHAVRATYLYAGMADVAALTQNKAYIDAIDKIWQNAAGKKTYITGGIGAAGGWEGFGPDYDLPNQEAYCETCAGIANVFWNHRMFLLTGEAKYMDMVERTLYNGILGGIGLDGKSFYYANPMEYAERNGKLSGENKRSPWFKCSCCPSNVCRFMPSIPGYIFAQKNNNLYVNLLIGSETTIDINEKEKLGIKMTTETPWTGLVKIEITQSSKKGINQGIKIRVPGWASENIFPTDLYYSSANTDQKIIVKLNGTELQNLNPVNGYLEINSLWKKGDKIELLFPMEVKIIKSNEKIKENKNLIAFQKGPIVYCAEFADNNGKTSNIFFPEMNQVSSHFENSLLNGVNIIETDGRVVDLENNSIKTMDRKIKLIPYFARSNRGKGEMNIWFKTKVNNLILESE